jgi:hypothetical protein
MKKLIFLIFPLFCFGQKPDRKIDFKLIPYTYIQKTEDYYKDDSEKYQMIYYSKNIVERDKHAKWIYASYDMYYGEEFGFGISFYLNQRKKYNKKN